MNMLFIISFIFCFKIIYITISKDDCFTVFVYVFVLTLILKTSRIEINKYFKQKKKSKGKNLENLKQIQI